MEQSHTDVVLCSKPQGSAEGGEILGCQGVLSSWNRCCILSQTGRFPFFTFFFPLLSISEASAVPRAEAAVPRFCARTWKFLPSGGLLVAPTSSLPPSAPADRPCSRAVPPPVREHRLLWLTHVYTEATRVQGWVKPRNLEANVNFPRGTSRPGHSRSVEMKS